MSTKRQSRELSLISFSVIILVLGSFGFIKSMVLTPIMLVHWWVPALFFSLPGLIATLWLNKIRERLFLFDGIVARLLFGFFSAGGIVLFLFTFTNCTFFHDNESRTVEVPILRTGKHAQGRSSCSKPYARVEIDGYTLDIEYPCDADVLPYRSVKVFLRCGLFGFEVICGNELQP